MHFGLTVHEIEGSHAPYGSGGRNPQLHAGDARVTGAEAGPDATPRSSLQIAWLDKGSLGTVNL